MDALYAAKPGWLFEIEAIARSECLAQNVRSRAKDSEHGAGARVAIASDGHFTACPCRACANRHILQLPARLAGRLDWCHEGVAVLVRTQCVNCAATQVFNQLPLICPCRGTTRRRTCQRPGAKRCRQQPGAVDCCDHDHTCQVFHMRQGVQVSADAYPQSLSVLTAKQAALPAGSVHSTAGMHRVASTFDHAAVHCVLRSLLAETSENSTHHNRLLCVCRWWETSGKHTSVLCPLITQKLRRWICWSSSATAAAACS